MTSPIERKPNNNKNHPLVGKYFIASKIVTLNESGPSTVIKKKKNGLFMCITGKGEHFDYPENELKKATEYYKELKK